jgi:hypothetical protein
MSSPVAMVSRRDAHPRPPARPARRRQLLRAPRVIAALIVVILLGALGLTAMLSGGHGKSARVTRAELVAYEASILPIVQDGGKTVEEGMKPALTDLLHRHITPPSFIVKEGDAWIAELSRVRQQLVAVTPPPDLAPASRLLAQSLDYYLTAARDFRAAAAATSKSERARFADLGVRAGEAGDAVYDRGSAVIQHARQRLGLPLNPNFPSPAN